MSCRLQNYLRTERKRAGLSQAELAFLLGCGSGSKVSRYERFRREPGLKAALACEALFGVPTRELFAGLYDSVERDVRRRAQLLTRHLAGLDGRLATSRKLALLGKFRDSASRAGKMQA
jgi:transcriptional regulator with XRE-family HTH domain